MKPIDVTRHAVRRFRSRERDQRSFFEIGAQIEREVRQAISAGRVLDHKPRHFRLYKEKTKGRLDPGFRLVEHESGARAYIVDRSNPERDVVLTTLHRAVAEA